MKLKYKLILTVAAILIFFNALFTVYYIYNHMRREQFRMEESIEKRSEDIVNTITETMWTFDKEKAWTYLKFYLKDDIRYIHLRDRANVMDLEISVKNYRHSPEDIIRYYPIEKNNLVLGGITIVFGKIDMEQEIVDFRRSMMVLTFSQVILVIISIYVVLHFVTRPAARLLEGMRLVNNGKLGYRIKVGTTDEFGILGNAFNRMSESLKKITASRDELNREIEIRIKTETDLKEALANVRTLQGFLPICASCKKIRDDKGYWSQVEEYLHKHSDVQFSHTICKDCMKELYPETYEKKYGNKDEENQKIDTPFNTNDS